MKMILKSLNQAAGTLFKGQVLFLFFIPIVTAILLVMAVFLYFGGDWAQSLQVFFGDIRFFSWLQETFTIVDILAWISWIFIFLLFVPLAYLAALLVTSVLVVPWVLHVVAKSDFADLERKRGGTTLGSFWNALSAGLIFGVAFLLTLPFWLLPGMQVALPVLLTAWLNKRVFLYDVLQDYASREERLQIERSERSHLYVMGILLSFLNYFPLALFFVPLLSALCYTYYGLNALKRLRRV